MVDLLRESDFDQIRWAMDLTLDASVLPNWIIRQPIYLFSGEAQVKARVVDWATRTGDDLTHMRNAAIYYTAALLCPAIPTIKSERSSEGQQYDRDTVNWNELNGELQSRGDIELDYVLAPGVSAPNKPTFFATAPGGRGR